MNDWILKSTQATFFQFYFNDVLAGTIILAFANAIAPANSGAARFVSSLMGSLVIICFASFVWEVFGSFFRAGARADPLDVLAYIAGATLYLVMAGLTRRLARG